MAANPQTLPPPVESLEQAALKKKLRQQLKTLLRQAQEIQETLDMLEDPKKVKRVRPEKDEHGEPSWEFLLPCVIPKGMHVTKRMREYGAELGFEERQVVEIFQQFYLYFTSGKNGQKKHLNWYAGFQLWIRRERERQKASGTPRPSRFDQYAKR